jgi:hypothetical protein
MSTSKYHNRKTMVDNVLFSSLKEANRYKQLKLRLYANEIRNLVCQPCFPLVVNGVLIGKYYGDFSYEEVSNDAFVLEDVKSEATRTQLYRLKKKLVKAIYNIEIREV